MAHEKQGTIDDDVEVGGLEIHGGGSGEAEQVFNQVAAAAAFGRDEFQALHCLVAFFMLGLARRDRRAGC